MRRWILATFALVVVMPSALPRDLAEDGGKKKDIWKEIREYNDKQVEALKSQGWTLKETDHYRILSNSDDKTVLPGMAKYMELMFKSYIDVFKPKTPPELKSLIVVFKSRGDYNKGAKSGKEWTIDPGPQSSGAYYSPETKVLVGFVDKETILNFFFHEGTHQFFDLSFPGSFANSRSGEGVPTWLSEGIADCFGASTVKGTTIYFNDLGSAVGSGRLAVLKSVIASGKHIPLDRLINMSKAEYYKIAQTAYAEGWGFCYFLFNYPNKGGNGGVYKKILVKLVEAFKEGDNRKTAYGDAFKNADLKKMDAEYKTYMLDVGN